MRFDVDEYVRWRLLEGLDDIGLTLRSARRDRQVRGRPARAAATHRHHRVGVISGGEPSSA